MPLFEPKYKYNQTILKVLGYGNHKKIKVITMNVLRTAGLEISNNSNVPRGSVNNEKLDNNIRRAKNTIFEYAFCNPWQWFFTATLDKKKYERTDLDKFHKDITQFFRNFSKKHNIDIKFLLIPELHSDGKSWHMHGLLFGLPVELLQQFKIGDKMSVKLAEKVFKQEKIYNWVEYMDKFGFCDLEPIKDAEAVSKYITKYINKNLSDSVKDLNAHLYYCSRGLQKAQVIKKGTMFADIVPDFENEYCRVSEFPFSDDLLQKLSSSFIDNYS